MNQEIQKVETKEIQELQPTFDNQTARMLIQSGLFGQKYQKPEQMMAIVLMGREQGLSPMQALTYGYNINGRSDVEVKARWANVQRAKNPQGGSLLSKCVTRANNDETCTVILERNNGDTKSSIESTYTIQQAEKAGLLNKPIWKQHPAKMLYWRALGNAIDMLFPDVRIGLHKQFETHHEAVLGQDNEEIDDWNKEPEIEEPKKKSPEGSTSFVPGQSLSVIDNAKLKALWTVASSERGLEGELYPLPRWTPEQGKDLLLNKYGFKSSKDVTIDKFYEIIEYFATRAGHFSDTKGQVKIEEVSN
jgi:hypothetical protein